MAFVSPEYVKSMQLQHNCPYWRVTDRTKKLVINRNESAVLNTSIDQLQETLNNCSGDYVFVTLYTVKPEKAETDTKRGQSFDLMVKLDDPFVNTPQKGAVAGAPTFSDLLALHSKIQQYEIEKIKSQYEAASEIKETAFDKLINKLVEGDQLNTLISILMTKINKPKAAISGPAPADQELAQAFQKFESVDPDYKNTIVKMAEYLTKNPAVLPQIKAIIGA